MTRIRFDEVSLTGRKSGKCHACGKPASRQTRFWQTISPFNKNADGCESVAPHTVEKPEGE
jgi:hypothetical protein